MSFSKNDLDRIKTKISIRQELEKKTKLIQKGKDYWCCCPFHNEKTPSCKINEDPGSFYCFGCGAKGDIFTIYTDLYNYNFLDAVKELSQQAGIEINFLNNQNSLKENKVKEILDISCTWFQNNLGKHSSGICNKYLESRNLTKETVKKFRLGYSSNNDSTLYDYLYNKGFSEKNLLESNVVKKDKNNKIRDFFYNRLIFPIMSLDGSVIGFGGRSLDNSNPKYINSPESKFFQKRYQLYNLNLAKNFARKKNNLLICEGYMDVISLNQNGISSVVAPLGTALTENQLELAWKYSVKPTIMFDSDTAGIRASYKSAIMSLPLISPKKFLQFVILPQGYDPDKYINEVSLNEFIKKLKKPESLSNFIFNQSVKSLSLENTDEKISYDKYLDDLIETIKDKKIKYFYKNDFKSLFFKKIRKLNNPNNKNLNIKKTTIDLSKKQILSFFSAAINNISYRQKILDALSNSTLLEEININLINELKKNEIINLKKDKILLKFSNSTHINLLKECLSNQIYELFPYSSPSFDPQLSYEELIKSINNLNTRLLNLKKINKSLDNFVNNSNALNWSELQSINIEIIDED